MHPQECILGSLGVLGLFKHLAQVTQPGWLVPDLHTSSSKPLGSLFSINCGCGSLLLSQAHSLVKTLQKWPESLTTHLHSLASGDSPSPPALLSWYFAGFCSWASSMRPARVGRVSQSDHDHLHGRIGNWDPLEHPAQNCVSVRFARLGRPSCTAWIRKQTRLSSAHMMLSQVILRCSADSPFCPEEKTLPSFALWLWESEPGSNGPDLRRWPLATFPTNSLCLSWLRLPIPWVSLEYLYGSAFLFHDTVTSCTSSGHRILGRMQCW